MLRHTESQLERGECMAQTYAAEKSLSTQATWATRLPGMTPAEHVSATDWQWKVCRVT